MASSPKPKNMKNIKQDIGKIHHWKRIWDIAAGGIMNLGQTWTREKFEWTFSQLIQGRNPA